MRMDKENKFIAGLKHAVAFIEQDTETSAPENTKFLGDLEKTFLAELIAHLEQQPEGQRTVASYVEAFNRDAGDDELAYAKLEHIYASANKAFSVMDKVEWHDRVKAPGEESPERKAAVAAVAKVRHELITDIWTGRWIDDAHAREQALLNHWERRNLELMGTERALRTAISSDLVARIETARIECATTWEKVKEAVKEVDSEGDPSLAKGLFDKLFMNEGPLDTLFKLQREAAEKKAAKFGCSPFEATMYDFEPAGLKTADIDRFFDELEKRLPPIFAQAEEESRKHPVIAFPDLPEDIQKIINETMLRDFGFDFDRGCVDIATHPFCTNVAGETRVTTRAFNIKDFFQSFRPLTHEAGHALYGQGLPFLQQGLPIRMLYQPVMRDAGTFIHESQSTLWERSVGKSREFSEYLSTTIKNVLQTENVKDEQGQPLENHPAFSPENIYREATKVERSRIRVNADEISYHLHILMRYRIERDLFDGKLEVKELPQRWKSDMKKYLELDVPEEDCLQDTHWFQGYFGYFQSYTLGTAAGAQLFAKIEEDAPHIRASIREGDFAPVLNPLRHKLHALASLLNPDRLIHTFTGQEFSIEYLLRHFEQRYLPESATMAARRPGPGMNGNEGTLSSQPA
jgi:carboxypeptidase Taq